MRGHHLNHFLLDKISIKYYFGLINVFKNKLIKIIFFLILSFACFELFFRTYDFVTNKTIENVKNNISYFSNYKNHPFLVYTGRKNQSGYQIHLNQANILKQQLILMDLDHKILSKS